MHKNFNKEILHDKTTKSYNNPYLTELQFFKLARSKKTKSKMLPVQMF